MQPLEAMKLRAKTDRHSNHHPTVNAVLAAKPERCDPQGPGGWIRRVWNVRECGEKFQIKTS
jgi:hypothetical protein